MNISVAIILLLLSGSLLKAQEFSIESFVDTAKTEGQYIEQHLNKYITPEYLRRNDHLRSYQRDGYSNILMGVLNRDLVHALIDYVNMSFRIDFTMNHGPVFYPSQTRIWLALPFDWKLPRDPWKKEWWRK